MKMKNNTKLTFKPFDFSDKEYEAYVRVWNAYYPDEVYAPEEFKHEDELRDKKYIFQRFRVEENGKIIGFCAYRETPFGYKPGKLMVSVYLDQAYLGIKYQTALYNFLMVEIEQHNPTQLASMAREDKPERVEFYKNLGFRQVMRSPRSRLDVQSFEIDPFTALIGKLEKESIEFVSVTTLSKRDPDWIVKWRELQWELTQDVPTTAPPEKQSLEVYKKIPDAPGFFPDGCTFALDQDEMIGLSFLWLTPADDSIAFTGLTGTKRDYRCRGIATAMKVKSIIVAKAAGIQTIETSNEENNPMFQLNLKLGYKPAPAWLEFEKMLTGK